MVPAQSVIQSTNHSIRQRANRRINQGAINESFSVRRFMDSSVHGWGAGWCMVFIRVLRGSVSQFTHCLMRWLVESLIADSCAKMEKRKPGRSKNGKTENPARPKMVKMANSVRALKPVLGRLGDLPLYRFYHLSPHF